jgi:hypothetical protein
MIAYPVYNAAYIEPARFSEDSVLTEEVISKNTLEVIPAFCHSCLSGVLLKRTILDKPE